jgi:uncharacterized protein (TIGR02246 family)
MRFRPNMSACAWIVLWLIVPSASAQEVAPVPKWAEDLLQTWYAAYNRGDASAVASLFTVSARLGPDQGRGAIRANLKRAFAKTNYNCTGRFDAIREIGELAVGWGVDTCLETPKPIGSPVTTKERWLAVFERQPDGRWLISRETWQDLVP